ncbi:hypothetical protein FCM35_KLT01831 [Carex littledalei]|uniref:Uncharacterized protein n=1 Tax=Carex littledalei TaxID=544730 RepID=A0A833RAQ3_9POAL|nr:hypothetical protein FCM35_KLT01831 [Carex littledalei]
MGTNPPLDLFSDKEREVASILLEVSGRILDSAPQVPLEKLQWGARRPRTEPRYQFKSEPGRSEPTGPASSDEVKKRQEETTSPVTPLCFPNSGSEEQIVTSPVKQVKKPYNQKERLKEKREQVAALTKEKADLSRELKKLQERFQELNARKFYLKDQKSKLSSQAEWQARNKLKPWGPTQATNWSAFVVGPQWAPLPPPPIQAPIERPRLELDLNAEATDDVSEYGEVAQLTCQSDRENRLAKSAQARKRRLEIQRERRTLPSSAQKRPRVRR